jgi:hypothetical protein
MGMGMGVGAAAPPEECADLGEFESQAAYQECLRNATTTAEIMEIVGTAPENVTQKQTDAVYAFGLELGEYEFNETERKRITEWMTWEKLGIRPEWSRSTTTGTTSTTTRATTTATTAKASSESDGTATRSGTTATTTRATTEATGGDRAAGSDGSDDRRPIDENVALTEWSESDGTFVLTFENSGERPVTVTLTESTQGDEGTYRFAITEKRLLPGETTITMTTKVKGDESAVSITTPASREAGHGVGISTGTQGANPFRHFGGTTGVLSGVGITILLSASAAVWVVWREESGVVKA